MIGHQQRSGGRSGRKQGGMTLVELIVAFTILMTLTSMAVPMARYKVRRDRERELRIALREMRSAIDKYKDMADSQKFGQTKMDTYGYPESLEIMVEGVKVAGSVDTKVKFLRRIPIDPFTGKREWGMRSMQDDPKSLSWGGQNLFDVYSKTQEKARDGTPYAEW
jgi:general secretion pathway protein G